jgi:parallel beta-helix repeat protein
MWSRLLLAFVLVLGPVLIPLRAAEYFLAPDGDDAADGLSRAAAWRDLRTAVHRIQGGDTLWVAEGTYRGKVSYTNTSGRADAPVRVRALPGEVVQIKGSVEVSGWVPVPEREGVWKIAGWNHNSQQVFVDDELMTQLGWPSEYTRLNACGCNAWLQIPHGMSCAQIDASLGGAPIVWPLPSLPENSFFYDAPTGDLYLALPNGIDPNTRRVEVSNQLGIFYDEVGHLILEDLHFLHASTLNSALIGWAGVLVGRHSVLRGGSVSWCDAIGVSTRSHARIENVFIGHHGINGISNHTATNVTIRGCTIRYNNYRGYTLNNAGGIKNIPDSGGVVEDCDVSFNRGPGIWFDSCQSGAPIVIRNNRVEGNVAPPGTSMAAYGIFVEVSRNAQVYNNQVISNQYIGIEVSASSDVAVHHNRVTGGHALAAVRIHNFSPDLPLDNVSFFNNLLVDNSGSYDLILPRANEHLSRRLTCDHNLYHRATGGSGPRLVWGGAVHTSLATWQAASGFDLQGLNAPPLLDASGRPLPGSPAIDAGTPRPEVPFAHDRRARAVDGDGNGTARPDIGPFEWHPGVVRYVDPAAPASAPPYDTPASAATNLVQALAVAQPGEVIELVPGEHPLTSEVRLDRAILLRGRADLAPAVLLAAGSPPHRVLSVDHPEAAVEDLTVVGGAADRGGGVWMAQGELRRVRVEGNHASTAGGGVWAEGSARLTACTLVNNTSDGNGGGCALSADATAAHTSLTGNSAAGDGGGAWLGGQASLGLTLASGNRAARGGGVFAQDQATVTGRLSGNTADTDGGGLALEGAARGEGLWLTGNQAGARGGGAFAAGADTRLRNVEISGNRADTAGGIGLVAGQLQFATVTGNQADTRTGGLEMEAAARGHSVIVAFNQAPQVPDLAAATGAELDYSLSPTLPPGVGGLAGVPRFRNRAGGDYRLSWPSPGVDSGHPSDTPLRDLREFPRVRNGDSDTVARADMGAFESGEVFYVDVNSPAPAAPYANWSQAARTLQEALGLAPHGALVLVAPGTYPLGSTVSIGRAVEVRSLAGPLLTTLDGQNNVRAAMLTHAEAILDGFTLRRGRADSGAGVYLRRGGLVRHCQLTDNEATGDLGGQFTFLTGNFPYPCRAFADSLLHEGGGGAALGGGGTLENCLLHGNRAPQAAGVVVAGGGTLRHCTVVANTATVRGGGVVIDAGRLEASIVHGNTAPAEANLWRRGPGGEIRHSLANPLPVGETNLDGDPGLDGPAGLFRPQAGSQVLDRAPATGAPRQDLGGTARPADGDGDGFSRPDLGAWEWLPHPGAADADRDGLSDEREATHGSRPDQPDTDGDGVPDGEEIEQGTGPLDAQSWLRIRQAALRPGGVQLTWRSVSNTVYHVQRGGALGDGFPLPVAGPLAATPPLNTHTDPDASGAGPYYYRVVGEPVP